MQVCEQAKIQFVINVVCMQSNTEVWIKGLVYLVAVATSQDPEVVLEVLDHDKHIKLR